MDEANFALGVLNFDPVHNQPHAPFFPLWVAFGKVVYWLAPESGPAGALQLVSAACSVLILWPLWALWSQVLPRALALGATVLYLFLPGIWLLSGRAYSEPAATVLIVAAVASWLPTKPSRTGLAAGAVGVAAALLVRPQWLPAVLPLVIWRCVRSRGLVDRLLVVGVPAVIGGAAVSVVAHFSGGIAPLWAAVRQHRLYMAGAARDFDWGFADFGLHAAAGGVAVGVVWLGLAAIGWCVLFRDRETRSSAFVVLALVLVPFVLLLLATQNPTLPRYALPILALTAGPVVAGIQKVARRPGWTLTAVAVWVAVSVGLTAPVLATYRRDPSPVVAAFGHVEKNPGVRALAVDRKLVAFVTLERALGRLRQQIVWDYQVELGMVRSPFRADLAVLSASPNPEWVAAPGQVSRFKCVGALLCRIASPRFLDLTVIEGCALVQGENPSVRPEDLRPGAVIPAR